MASRKHKCWGKKAIANTYFLIKDETRELSFKQKKYVKFKNTKWVFHGITKSKFRYKVDKHKTIYVVDVLNILQLLSSKYFILSKNLLSIHGYHFDYMKLVTFNINLNFKSAGFNSLLK